MPMVIDDDLHAMSDDVCNAETRAVLGKLLKSSLAELTEEARADGHACAVGTQSELLLASLQNGTKFPLLVDDPVPASTAYPLACKPLPASVWQSESLAQYRSQCERAQRESHDAFVAAYTEVLSELGIIISEALVVQQQLRGPLCAANHQALLDQAMLKCESLSSSARPGDPPCVGRRSRPARAGLVLETVPVKDEFEHADYDVPEIAVPSHTTNVAETTIADILAEQAAKRNRKDLEEWERARRLASWTGLSCTVDENEAAVTSRIRQKADEIGISTAITPEDAQDIFAAIGRGIELPWMTFHRNPYCWHELLNYLGIDPLARGFLYGLANINAVGWQEAGFILLKCVDEETIAESAWLDNLTYHQVTSSHQGLRTPSKRVMSYAKNAMAHHSLTAQHPMWQLLHASIAGNELVRTAWNQETRSPQSPMNQPQYLADPGIIYRSLAGRMGLVEWPPCRQIPGAGWEPFKGGPRHYAMDLLKRLPSQHWAAHEDSHSGKAKGKGASRPSTEHDPGGWGSHASGSSGSASHWGSQGGHPEGSWNQWPSWASGWDSRHGK